MNKRKFSIFITLLAGLLITLTQLAALAAPSHHPASEPAPDGAFSAPITIGPGSRYYVEDPHIVTEDDGSLSLIWSFGVRDHVFYAHSTDAGRTWTEPESIGGNPLWGGSEGNLWLATDPQGRLHGYWYRLYGENYPSLEYRYRTAGGVWMPSLEVPGSQADREKINALGVDHSGTAYLLAGHSGTTLSLFSTDGVDFGPQFSLPMSPDSYPNPVWRPNIAFSGVGNAMLVTWGDMRLGQYNVWTAWQDPKSLDPGHWNSYAFTDTGSASQYAVASLPLKDGGIGLAFESRDDEDAKDIYYREWNPKKYGLQHSGWTTDSIRLATEPIASEAPTMCADRRGQRYLVWQDSWDNLRITYSYSADGVHWHEPMLVNTDGAGVREKHPTCTVLNPTDSDLTGHLYVGWVDKREDGQARLYLASRPLPDLYPPPPPATPTVPPAP